jgi:FKBP-type peptidyl-prolyl cis-trans isomerase SlyD
MKISSGKSVSIEYTMSFDGEEPVETSQDSEPLSFVQGEHEILSGIEQALEGLESGAEKTVVLGPDEAFGGVDSEAVVDVDLSRLPEDAQEPGAVVETHDDQGQTMTGEVIDVSEGMATIDFNHPLAGKTLEFGIKVLSVAEGTGSQEDA